MWMYYLTINLLGMETNNPYILTQTRKFKLTGVWSLHSQDPCKSGLLLFKPIHSQRWSLCKKEVLKNNLSTDLSKIYSIHMSKMCKTYKFVLSLTEKHNCRLYKDVFWNKTEL